MNADFDITAEGITVSAIDPMQAIATVGFRATKSRTSPKTLWESFLLIVTSVALAEMRPAYMQSICKQSRPRRHIAAPDVGGGRKLHTSGGLKLHTR
jgi:hypothetical protein